MNVAGLLCAAVFLAAVWAVAWGVRALLDGRFFPPRRPWVVTWTGWELLLLVLLIQIVWPVLMHYALHHSGFLDYFYRPKPAVASTEENGDKATEETEDASLRRSRDALWIYAAMFPFQVLTIVGVLWGLSRTRPEQLGLTTRRLGQNLALGFLGWLLFAPPVFVVNLIVTLLYRWLFHVKEEEHPLTRLLRFEPRTAEITLIIFTAVVAAPIFEELLFRGVLQPWFARRRWGGLVALAAAVIVALMDRLPKIRSAWNEGGPAEAFQETGAIVFVLLMIPGYFLARILGATLAAWRQDREPELEAEPLMTVEERIQAEQPPLVPPDLTAPLPPLAAPPDLPTAPAVSPQDVAANWAGAIYATAILFAAAHSAVWPTPIALFFLALGLGYVAYRTHSLAGSIVMHGLFNGVSVAMFLLMPHVVENGKDATSAVPRVPAVSNSSAVPGSWLPRRM